MGILSIGMNGSLSVVEGLYNLCLILGIIFKRWQILVKIEIHKGYHILTVIVKPKDLINLAIL